MRMMSYMALIFMLAVCNLTAQDTSTPSQSPNRTSESKSAQVSSAAESGDIDQLRSEIQRLTILLNQMRNNLAFVQTSQTPLKHQFELEADAWQLIVDQMDRRLRAMEERAKTTGSPSK